MTKNIFLVLALFFAVSFFFRVLYLPQNAISFAYDQARDAFIVREILAGDLKILGPSVSGVPGLHHGVLYYYLLAIPYYFGEGNPISAAYFFSFIGSFGVFVAFWLAYVITHNVKPGILSALFFALSFEATQYANLLTNVTTALLFVPLTYIGLYLWLTEKNSYRGPLWVSLCGFSFGLSVQSEFALLYHIIPILFWIVYSGKVKINEIIFFGLSFALATFTMLLVEFKFGFQGVRGLLYLLAGKDGISKDIGFGDFVITFLNQTGETLANNIFPINIAFGGLLGFGIITYSILKIKVKKEKVLIPWQYFLFTYIFAHLPALTLGGSNMRHIMTGAQAGIAVFLGIFSWIYLSKNKLLLYVFTSIVISANLFKIATENKDGQTIFPLQKDLVLSKELEAVGYTYTSAAGEEFSINTLTSPLYVNTLWSYLYNWHGQKEFGYLPYWTGKDQIGQPGNNLETKSVKLNFYIIEPRYGIPELFVNLSQGEENSKSELIEEKSFGDIIVQKRLSKITP